MKQEVWVLCQVRVPNGESEIQDPHPGLAPYHITLRKSFNPSDTQFL